MNSEFLVKFLEERRTPIVKKKYHSYLSYRGIKEDYIYILKEGVVKTSVIMRDGREFNFSYLKAMMRCPTIQTHLSMCEWRQKKQVFIVFLGSSFGILSKSIKSCRTM